MEIYTSYDYGKQTDDLIPAICTYTAREQGDRLIRSNDNIIRRCNKSALGFNKIKMEEERRWQRWGERIYMLARTLVQNPWENWGLRRLPHLEDLKSEAKVRRVHN